MKLADKFIKYGNLKKEMDKLKKELDEEVKSKGGFLDLGAMGGVLMKDCERETLDKKKVKVLLGDSYKLVSKITKYDMVKLYTNEDSWKKYKLVFTKGGQNVQNQKNS